MNRLKKFACLAKLFIASVTVHVFRRGLLRENLWLFQEKHTEARDNGYHFYTYVKEKHPEIKAYYSIVKGSPDAEKIRHWGTTVDAETMKHYIYWVAAKYSINSQPFGAAPWPTDVLYRFRRLCRKDQKTVYLKHGVDKDELPHFLDHDKTRFSLIAFVAAREKEFMQKYFGYPDDVAQLLGFCRYDRLNTAPAPKKQILVMPTFRKWLAAEKVECEATEAEFDRFRNSDFFRNYRALLTNEKLLAAAGEKGYKIVFYLHYSLQSYARAFLPFENGTVVIADRQHYDVQQLMLESAAMVTDFSSVFFDFAYMRKPEVFFQFDEETYRKGHYKQGYFDYRRDGFGPVYTKAEDAAAEVISLMGADCKMEAEYLAKVDAFFAFFDSKNCERTYRAVCRLG